ncbi:MAG TPA: flagellar filament capping protein FliD, partial [Rhodocyclaceae bacterium]|nr:flagellar filament capping protein FliD [Rhodocyclaceae bacterium]
MATITSLGIGSGLDVEGLVTKLMAVEKLPLTALDTKESTDNSKISALGSLASSISALQTAASAFVPGIGQTAQTNLATYSATLADTTVGTATAGTSASSAVGDYTLTVDQTAHSDRVVFDAGLTLTAGTLNVSVGSGTASPITVTAGMTLAQLRDAINGGGGGVTATLIGGAQLVLTSNTSGAAGRLTVSGNAGFTKSDGTAGSFSWTPSPTGGTGTGVSQPAGNMGQDAKIELNGVTLTSSSNTFASAIDGVDIKLSPSAVANTTTTLSVKADTTTKATDAVNAFVKAYNAFIAQVKQYGYYNATTKTAGTLQGDYTLRSAQSDLYKLISTTPTGVTGTIKTLSDLGVSVQRDGTLSVDSTKLS